MSDTFDNILPLPYRIISLLLLGSWLWLIILKISFKYNINLIQLLKINELSSSILEQKELYTRHEKTCINISLISIISYLISQFLHNKDIESITIWDFLPILIILIIAFQLIKPNNHGSKRLISTFNRILRGKISQNLRTNDILLSDTLTSYSKILIDLAIYSCHLINNKTCLPKSTGPTLSRTCGESIMLDSLIGLIPTFIRLKQCLWEYKLSNFRNKLHLLNFFKYSTNLPIVILGVYIRFYQIQLTKFWVFLALINSSYTFIWDINNDWNLNLLKFDLRNLLRSKIIYNKVFYGFAIIIDFLLRFIWIWKFLSPATENSSWFYSWISSLFSSEFGIFSLEILEILRRFIWILIKLEVDYINLDPIKDIELNELK
ncbi:putative membrane protein [Wickerhamomyces ciferrii]|uniref:Membrane protein n=1 Tax=Wickerhamomyces ciferrii (strain ATCC 14091 / BCRC 22168 / CBS 111 / JCM 3599 / NBRC 0793 / NRRL Y-1031 F-60-10) TaxID=1206466 RepID=K0L093_WICCF|nr:uncharacterized protein BN7_6434 [Wickerhamomyces ciferrii]CCH46833.1 putative membrane protein [Wickerhamomyces ciferrii]